MSDLGRRLEQLGVECGVKFHMYADDVLLYISGSPDDISRTSDSLHSVVKHVETWMSDNFLQLNIEKTHLFLIHKQRTALPTPLPTLAVGGKALSFSTSGTLRWLGVHIDTHLSMNVFINDKCRSCYGVLRMLRQVRPSLLKFHARLLCNALVVSRIDYCISVLANLSKVELKKLQRVVKLAARIISGYRRYDHISPVLRELSWPISTEQRIKIKLAVLVFKALRGCLPKYLADEIHQYHPRRALRSSTANATQLVLGTASTSHGRRAWRATAPATWNSLPEGVREAGINFPTFMNRLTSYVLNI
jgi:hypothetical protein